MRPTAFGLHKTEQYSNIGITNDLYSMIIQFKDREEKVLRIQDDKFLAFLTIAIICFWNVQLLSIRIARSLLTTPCCDSEVKPFTSTDCFLSVKKDLSRCSNFLSIPSFFIFHRTIA